MGSLRRGCWKVLKQRETRYCWDDEYEFGDQVEAHLMRNNDVMTILLAENTDDWEKEIER